MKADWKQYRFLVSRASRVVLLAVLVLLIIVLALELSGYVFCNTVAICDTFPTMTVEQRTYMLTKQYEYAQFDIQAGRYREAQERLQYVLQFSPAYPGAAEKLREVNAILVQTPAP